MMSAGTETEKVPIGVVGVGWVGLVTAACFAELGHKVVARDIAAAKIETLLSGEVPIHEPGLRELIAGNSERLTFTTELEDLLAESRLIFICVETPPTHSGDADLTAVQRAIEEIGAADGRAVVMKSTVPVGTGETLRRRLSASGAEIAYVSCPEFLREGSAVKDFLDPDRVVIGAGPDDAWAADAVAAAYEPTGGPIVRTDVSSAEMIKLASNAFLATKISFINEIANVCEELGADVEEVARGMGMDPRIGDRFLNAGVGYGGSCLVGEESVMVRRFGRVRMVCLGDLFTECAREAGIDPKTSLLIDTPGLEVASVGGGGESRFYRVECLTRRNFEGEIIEVRTKMGRRLRCTPDHPFLTVDGRGANHKVKLADDLTEDDWLPLAAGEPHDQRRRARTLTPAMAMAEAGIREAEVIVRLGDDARAQIASLDLSERDAALEHPRGSRLRLYDVARTGTARLDEVLNMRLPLAGASLGTARNGTYTPVEIPNDEAFWRVVGLYIAEGHCTLDGARQRLQWSFHPTAEDHLVDEVASFWERVGVKATVRRGTTTKLVSISSRLLAAWWTETLGLGRDCYGKRIPDLAWIQPEEHLRALLAGAWLGDGSWSFVNRGPSVILEYGTASSELADGILRALGQLGLVASLRIGRTAKSTTDNYWLRISGADQIKRAMFLVPDDERTQVIESMERQAKQIAPTGYRRDGAGATRVRVTHLTRQPFSGPVYSMHVPEVHTFAATGGLLTHNCFPKDTQALKQLAGNSGYHFQLLSAVIEVNELQKRRVVSKLTRHIGDLNGKTIALLGLAFKPDTDDMREASSLVLASRLEGEGAIVRAYDPVAAEGASQLLPTVEMHDSVATAMEGADGAVLVTEWPEFSGLDWRGLGASMETPLLVDGRNLLDAEEMRAAGFTYESIGRPSPAEVKI